MSGLVLLHGFTGSPASFDEVARLLATRHPSPRIFRPALLGHDSMVRRDVRRFEQEIDRLAALIGERCKAGPHLCGYSLGARTALGLIARHPFLFSSATLIGVHPGLVSESSRAERIGRDEFWCQKLLREGLAGFTPAWQAEPLFASQQGLPEALLRPQRKLRARHSPAGLIQSLRVLGLGQMPNYWGVLRAPPFEIRLVAGGLDSKFVELAREVATASQRVNFELVEGVGHNVVLEASTRVADVLTRALLV